MFGKKLVSGSLNKKNPVEITYLGSSTGGYTVTGPGIYVVAGMRSSSSNPVITSATMDGTSTSWTTIFAGGGDWMYGTSTAHKVGVYGYIVVPAGTHTIAVSSSVATEYQFFAKNAKTVKSVVSSITSRTITMNPGEATITAISSEKNAASPNQSSIMTQVYHSNNDTYAFKNATETGANGYITTTTYGRGGYIILSNE